MKRYIILWVSLIVFSSLSFAGSDTKSLFDQARDSAMKAASDIDWSKVSWDKVSEIPYEDKAQLLAWATSQVDTWKDKLSKVAMDKGIGGLSSLGDSGWQGALKDVASALDSVRKSNPETWDAAKGALVKSWSTFQDKAMDYLSK